MSLVFDNAAPSAVKVTVATEQEPVTADGTLTATPDGFVLEFKIGDDKFKITHGGDTTTVSAVGVMSYDITLGSGACPTTVLDTPYGKVRFEVKPLVREVKSLPRGFRLLLGYILFSEAAGEIARSVDITVEEP